MAVLVQWGCGSAHQVVNSCLDAGLSVPTWDYKQVNEAAVDWIEAHHQVQLGGQGNMPNIQDEEPHGGNMEALHLDNLEEVEVLENIVGVQTLTFHRANPHGLDRMRRLQLMVDDASTVQHVKNMILQQWPDLQATRWKVHQAHDTIKNAYYTTESEHFIVWTEADQMTTSSPITVLVEERHWNLQTGDFDNHFSAESLWNKFVNIPQFLSYLHLQGQCDRVPCPVIIDGGHLHWRQEVRLDMASHVVVYISQQEVELRSVIGDPTLYRQATPDEVPEGFLEMAITRARHYGRPEDKIGEQALRLQTTHTDEARKVFFTTSVDCIYDRKVAIFLAEVEEINFVNLHHSVDRDPFGLLYDLQERNMVSTASVWELKPIHATVRMSKLPMDRQYLLLLHPEDRPGESKVSVMAEKIFIQNSKQGGRELTAYITFFEEQTTNFEQIITTMRLSTVCELHECTMWIDGRKAQREVPYNIEDGSFIKLKIQQEEPKPQEDSMDVDDDNHKHEEDYPQDERAKRPRLLETESRGQRDYVMDVSGGTTYGSGSPPPGGDMVLGMVIYMLLKICTWSQNMIKGHLLDTTRDGNRHGKNKKNKVIDWKMVICLCMVLPVSSGLQIQQWQAVRRLGEASNPGPWWIGTSNPSGLRSKEWIYGELPPGIWGCSETQLTAEGITTSQRTLRRTTDSRDLHLLHGAPAAFRARSEDAGTWTGVGFITDLIPRAIHTQWPNQEYMQGRVQMARFWWGPTQITGANVYLWPRGPTWPKAVEASNNLLNRLTQEIVLSRTGLRFITGDFNHEEKFLDSIEIWKQQGWVDAQTYASEQWGREICATCKGKTVRDHIWLSPEFLPYIQKVQIWPVFADHSAVGVCVDLPISPRKDKVWPMPSCIPWQYLDKEKWQKEARCTTHTTVNIDVDDQYLNFWQDYETSFDGHFKDTIKTLPGACKGRGQIMKPLEREPQCPLLKPSRPGEAKMKNDCLGRSVQQWFLQLRRLQSLCHALKAGKMTADAQLYRASLWNSIKRGKGFHPHFEQWWRDRPHKQQGSPSKIPLGVPNYVTAELIYQDYMDNYRRYEAWHQRRRSECLQVAFESNRYKIFDAIKPDPKGMLQQMEEIHDMQIIGVSEDGTQIQLDQPLQPGPAYTCTVEDFPVEVYTDSEKAENEIYHIEADRLIQEGQTLSQTVHYRTPEEIQARLETFWSKRWWKQSAPSGSDWKRILAFGEAYIPKAKLSYNPITVEGWTAANKRYTKKSARGPDGVDRLDLQYMPDQLQEELVAILNRCEEERTWPKGALTGFVYPLAKKHHSIQPGEFRPVIIYPMVYRSWSSLRAKEILRHLGERASDRQCGFMPDSDPTQVWMICQAMVEVAVQGRQDLLGFVSDIVKAFENIPREPIWKLASHLGISSNIIGTWNYFLQRTERRFLVRNQIGEGVGSNSGFPEGCAMSCVAMAIVDVTYHAYLRQYSARCKEISYVDNLETFCTSEGDLHASILTMETWAELWRLDLDHSKSYVWATNSNTRTSLRQGKWRVAEVEKDLGAAISYGKRSAKKIQQERLDSLQPLFEKLKRVMCPEWQKQAILRQALWPRGLYGSAICRVGWEQIRSLRTAATRALRQFRAGAAPAIRLFFLSPEQCDPGFYMLWTTWQNFRRVARERPFLEELWKQYMERYDGANTQGPFNKLLEMSAMIGWHLQPPWVTDQDGITFNILQVSTLELYDTLKGAWTQKIAVDLCKRKDMKDLEGIDEVTFRKDIQKTPNFKKGGLDVLRDGTFLDVRTQKKFDYSIDGKCKLCGGTDSLEHRCVECPNLEEMRKGHTVILQQWPRLSTTLREHLIPSRNPWEKRFRLLLHRQHYEVKYDLGHQGARGDLHLFTDGSTWEPSTPQYALGAWAVVNASEDILSCSGAMEGARQTCDYTEVEAICHALEVARRSDRPTTIWTDSSTGGQGLQRLWQNIWDIPDGPHYEQWSRAQETLRRIRRQVCVQHVPGHRDGRPQHNDVEDWTAFWNSRADAEANRAHRLRDATLQECWRELWQHHRSQLQTLHDLRALHWEVLEEFSKAPSYAGNHGEMDEDEGEQHEESLVQKHQVERREDGEAIQDLLPDDWNMKILTTNLGTRFGSKFVKDATTWLMANYHSDESVKIRVSWLEIAIMHVQYFGAELPIPGLRGNTWVDCHTSQMAGSMRSLTVAAVIRLVKTFYGQLRSAFMYRMPSRSGINLVDFRVHTPLTGTLMWVKVSDFERALVALKCFTSRRPIRVANDLTRPLQ